MKRESAKLNDPIKDTANSFVTLTEALRKTLPNLGSCKKCKFNGMLTKDNLCLECVTKEEKETKKIEHPGQSTIKDLSEEHDDLP